MTERNDRSRPQIKRRPPDGSSHGAPVLFGGLWALLFLMTFLVAGPWAGFHGVLLGGLGLLVALRPPQARLPGAWWALAMIFALTGAAEFLPAGWFPVPEWRRGLESLGVETGALVTIQSRQAAEAYGLFVLTLFAGLWMTGHRPSPAQIRLWALVFTLGVACYALLARFAQDSPHFAATFSSQHFGFFPNRNHSATYLSMGAICGLGCVLQALRDKRFVILAVALAATALCLWALASWSISRAGVVLIATGGLLWVSMLGPRYLGRHGIWAIALIAITAVGLFLIANTEVRERLTVTAEKAGSVIGADPPADPDGLKSALDSSQNLDFRIPVFLDTLGLIREFPWTGIGAGQFFYVFPQYRKLTIIANDADVYHPESDWLWMVAETGIPATLALLTLVALAFWKSLKGIRHGRDCALRAACLVAAMLVPIHGFFDVPGHRITLAWSAVFLFVLSLPPPAAETSPSAPRAWPSWLLASCLLLASAFLIRAQWFKGPQPALTTAHSVTRQTLDLYQQNLKLQKMATAEGRTYQPDPANDLLEQALQLVHSASRSLPLNRELLRLESSLALQFDDKYPLADRAYALELALDPIWIAAPLRQAAAWSALDPPKTMALWQEALRRADRIDALKPGTTTSRDQTLQRIRQQAKGKPELESWSPASVGS